MYCTKCKNDKDISEFRIRKSLKRGYQSWCKDCENIENKKRYTPKEKKNKNKEYDPIATLKRMLKHRYKLSYDEYFEMYNKQEGKCAICKVNKILGTKKGLQIDHNHETNQVRGLLCTDCNTAIGKLKENITFFKNAIDYLNKYNE